MTFRLLGLGTLLGAALVVACDSSESSGPVDHDPDSATLVVNLVPMPDDTLRLPANATAAVRILFYENNKNLDNVEDEHFSTLTFTPSTGLVSTDDPAHHFRHDVMVTAVAGTTGDLAVGFGHDAAADETTLNFKYKVE